MQYRDLYESVWHLDADTLLNCDPSFLFEALDGYDVGLAMTPGRAEPQNRILACIIGFPSSEFSRRFLRLTAGYLADCWHMGRLQWGPTKWPCIL